MNFKEYNTGVETARQDINEHGLDWSLAVIKIAKTPYGDFDMGYIDTVLYINEINTITKEYKNFI